MPPFAGLRLSIARKSPLIGSLLLWFCLGVAANSDDDFQSTIKPFVVQHCAKCHSSITKDGKQQEEPKGEVDLGKLKTEADWLADGETIDQVIDVLDAFDMPPDSEPKLSDKKRSEIIERLKKLRARSQAKESTSRHRVRRLNRFQYNNTVRDLFQLDRDVFALSEKLMTRRSDYLKKKLKRMPEVVQVTSRALDPKPGMRNVKAFPKDLRAAHGFDNQSNQLTMSPLLLDAFLRLAVSILDSPDFNRETVGIWDDLFAEPDKSKDLQKETRQRLERFLTLAFRQPVDQQALDRYTQFATAKIESGMSYPDTMKKVASAVLSSPLFLFRVQSSDARDKQFELASNLSYFLWSSSPDAELLRLAAQGQLNDPQVLDATVDRMLADPKIERFLDSFPSQWLQLENVLAATPDPAKQRYFSLDSNYPASLQMLIEPLLLFDTAFVEDRPLADLITPDFGYQSDFLNRWYNSDLKPPPVDVKKIVQQNKDNDVRRQKLSSLIKSAQGELDALVDPIREKLLAQKNKEISVKPVDLKPLASWEFDGNLKASSGDLNLQAHGQVEFKDGMVVLNKSYLLSQPIPVDLKAKSLEVWCIVHNLDQRGGGLMGIQGQGDFFDTIVIGERKPRHWISGSNGFSRTLDFPDSTPENKNKELIHLVMVYQADGNTLLYRNGQPYGKPFNKGRAVFPKHKSQVIFGLRHLPAGGNRFLNVSIDRARLYDRALSPKEVLAANSGKHLFVSREELSTAMSKQQREEWTSLEKRIQYLNSQLKNVPANQDPNRVVRESYDRFDNMIRQKLRDQNFRRVNMSDPRYGGVITNAAIMSMTSGPKRSHPIARGAWLIEVIFNDPPPPPPNDVPPLNEDSGDQNLTIREKFKVHRSNPDCAGCHSRLDPLGFALENFDLTGRWRDKYENGREVDMEGKLLKRYPFTNVAEFKAAIVNEKARFAQAFTEHLLRFALARELSFRDRLIAEEVVNRTEAKGHSIKATIKAVIASDPFLNLK